MTTTEQVLRRVLAHPEEASPEFVAALCEYVLAIDPCDDYAGYLRAKAARAALDAACAKKEGA